MKELDFFKDAEEARKHKHLVANRLEGKIREFLSQNQFTWLVLVNGICFKGNWGPQFNKQQIKGRPFKFIQNKEKPVWMMFKKSTFNMIYIEEIVTKNLELSYIGKELNKIIVLPNENVSLEMVGKNLFMRNS